MSQALEERLKQNSSAFDGLLSLIPAKFYYDDETQNQWKAKKQSKTEVKQNKKNKLNPETQNDETHSALEVMKKKAIGAKPVVLPGKKQLAKAAPAAPAAEEGADEVDESADESDEKADGPGISVIFDDEGNEITAEEQAHINKREQLKEESRKKKEISEEAKEQKKKQLEDLRAKLQSKIQNMKTKRNAPSSREAILEARKRREEMLKKRKEQEKANQEESDSDSDDSDDEQPAKKQKVSADGVIFQNIMFDDGDRATSDLQRLRKHSKKKGPSNRDIEAHLKNVEAKKAKLSELDVDEKKAYEEKQKWQRAMIQAEGGKIKDDERLLKKALKRKEAQKRKSDVEWRERKQTVANTQQERIKRREENLKIRKDNKGKKRKHQTKQKRKFVGTVGPKKKRAGFEGQLKSGKNTK